MNAEDFKKSYVRWSCAVAFCIPTFLMAIAICDMKLGLDFSDNMYIMSVVAAGVLISFLSLTWINILNSKMFKDWISSGTASKETPKDTPSTVQQETPIDGTRLRSTDNGDFTCRTR